MTNLLTGVYSQAERVPPPTVGVDPHYAVFHIQHATHMLLVHHSWRLLIPQDTIIKYYLEMAEFLKRQPELKLGTQFFSSGFFFPFIFSAAVIVL